MLVQTGDGAVAWTTCLRFDRPLGRGAWAPASAVHRRLVPDVLRAAALRLGRPRAGRAATGRGAAGHVVDRAAHGPVDGGPTRS
jgi:hypothetical protein